MYDLKHFKAHNNEEVFEFIKNHPFVTICAIGEDGFPVATQVPILIEERNDKLFFLAHVMRKQMHTLAFEQNSKVLIIFTGNHTYISAKNYDNPATASTWNYKAVHCKGNLKFVGDEELINILTKLTHRFEQNTNSPALVEKMDDAYIQQHIKAIIGFEIEVQDVQHIFKLSQNKTAETKEQIISSLQQSNEISDQLMASEMNKFYNNN
jgi:transcriptional regulator